MMAAKGGVNNLDFGVLSREQQETLRQFKIRTRIANESYLRSHPEVDVIIGDFIRLLHQPKPSHNYCLKNGGKQ